MNGKRTTLYVIVAMCIVGIAVVGFFIFKYAPVNESFSELYFENGEQLPDKTRVGEEESFAFTVVSHEGDKSSYHYAVKFDDEVIKEGTFILLPQEEKTLDIEFSPSESSIAFVDSKTNLYTSHLNLDNIAGVIWSGGKTVESIPLLKPEDGNVILPINFSYDGAPGSSVLLRIDLDSKDTFHFSYTKKYDVKSEEKKEETAEQIINPGQREENKIAKINPPSRAGYDIIDEEQTITNDHGKITFIRKVVKSEYRYEKKKVSVKVSANGKEYEIYFCTIVEESNVES